MGDPPSLKLRRAKVVKRKDYFGEMGDLLATLSFAKATEGEGGQKKRLFWRDG